MDIASWWSGLFAGMSPASFVNFSFLPKYGVYFLQALGYTSAEAARAINLVRDQADTVDALIMLALRQIGSL